MIIVHKFLAQISIYLSYSTASHTFDSTLFIYSVWTLCTDSKIIGEMFYFVFFVTNYFALGFGFWLAMRHGEYLREHPLTMQTTNDGKTETIIEAVSNTPEDEDTESPPLRETPAQPILAQSENNDTSQISVQDDPETAVLVDDTITDQAELDETRVHKSKQMPNIAMNSAEMPSAGMIEQVIGMAGNVPDDDLQDIVSQLQEIHGVITNADNRCYISEDAEAFLTPHEEKYVTTAVCRPVVRRKK